jgi:hypothetical protein
MAIVVVGKEKSLTELTNGLLLARASKTSRTQAEEAIRAANPGLDLGRLSRGQVLVVPDLPQARATTVDHVESATTAIVEVLDEQLDELLEAAKEAQARTESEQADAAAALQEPALRKAVGDPDAKAVTDALRKTLAAQRRASASPFDLEDLVQRWRDEIDALAAMAGGQ